MPADRIVGRALVLGDNIDTDTIIPARHLHTTSPEELGRHVFEDAPEIRLRLERLEKPIVIIAGKGFGYGSSREHAAIALKAAGVVAVVAKSFHKIFYRNAINNGLPVLETPSLEREPRDGSIVEISLETGEVIVDGALAARAKPLPPMLREILETGGLHEKLRELARQKRATG